MRAMRLLACVAAVLGSACASAGTARAQDTPAQQSAEKAAAGQQPSNGGLVPPGFGTLKQDAFTVSLRSGALLVKVTPLTESVIRLAAPDTYTRLHALAESRRADAARRTPGGDPEIFLVSFFSYQPDVTFQPELLQLTTQGRAMRPAAILPMSAGWGGQRLGQQEVQTAVYVFDGKIDYGQQLLVRYEMQESDGWSAIVPVLDQERAKVQVRATNGG